MKRHNKQCAQGKKKMRKGPFVVVALIYKMLDVGLH